MGKINNRVILLNLNSKTKEFYDFLNFSTLKLKTKKLKKLTLNFDRIYNSLTCFQSEELKNVWQKLWNKKNNSIIFLAGHKFLYNVGQCIISFFMDQLTHQELNNGKKTEKWFGVSYVDHLGNIQNITTKNHPKSFYLSKFQSISQIETRYQDDISCLNNQNYFVLTTIKLIQDNQTRILRLIQLPSISYLSNQQKGIGKLLKDIQLKLYSHRKGYIFKHPAHPVLDLINNMVLNYQREKQNLLTILISTASELKFARTEILFGSIILKGEIKKIPNSIEFQKGLKNSSTYKDMCINLYNQTTKLQDEGEILKKTNIDLKEKKKKFKNYVYESREIISILSYKLNYFANHKLNLEKKFEQKGKKLSIMHMAPFQYYLSSLRNKLSTEKKKSHNYKKIGDRIKRKISNFKTEIENKSEDINLKLSKADKIFRDTNKRLNKFFKKANEQKKELKELYFFKRMLEKDLKLRDQQLKNLKKEIKKKTKQLLKIKKIFVYFKRKLNEKQIENRNLNRLRKKLEIQILVDLEYTKIKHKTLKEETNFLKRNINSRKKGLDRNSFIVYKTRKSIQKY